MSRPAPPLAISKWFNTPEPLDLSALKGKVVLLHAFQMLCPGCVSHGTPQAERAHRLFRNADLKVIGIHTVFEHKAAMTPVALEAYIHEYQLTLPIGVDEDSPDSHLPVTMSLYNMRGTPSSVIIDRAGTIRHQGFGQETDMSLGYIIGALLGEKPVADGE